MSMSDGSQQGIGADRALKTILGGEPSPEKEEERTPQFWRDRLLAKDDDIGGYEAHAEVMAKYIVLALKRMPRLACCPNESVYLTNDEGKIDWDSPTILVSDLSDVLKKVYPDEAHPFRRALSEATGFTWGWAFNIARYALGLPPQPNPAIITIGGA
jgi:hypothetical protein